jgi:hypothetical protein
MENSAEGVPADATELDCSVIGVEPLNVSVRVAVAGVLEPMVVAAKEALPTVYL